MDTSLQMKSLSSFTFMLFQTYKTLAEDCPYKASQWGTMLF